jgi:hypothetical protein
VLSITHKYRHVHAGFRIVRSMFEDADLGEVPGDVQVEIAQKA